ncbi:4'-phosphopantetheinyl transferase family protein [Aridibaculum aurantiacum]|uniref:4'-phosphopantetheinyl transferase family protein n=1 Tax=Aridibaculum aurantiacum TaxID=2810307 RepID=UPI001A9764AE|nr:4'-phosphopantetheinyl transferase superfamily protein [Aridibaculum aurantiacum]
MPLFYQQNINEHTRLGIWRIEEPEEFFLEAVPLQAAITHPQKRLQHLAGRYMLAHLFPGFPYHEILIADTRKPYLPNEQYHFSISHCSSYAAAIVSTESRVGVDVELVTARVEKIKHKFLHPDELRFVNAQLPSQQLQLLSLLWSAKEAMFKWYSYGDVDFSEMLRVFPFILANKGTIDACFIGTAMQVPLTLHYQLFDDLCMVQVMSDH